MTAVASGSAAHGATGGFAVLDVETTGLSPHADRVLEIAVVHVDPAGQVQQHWTTRVDPQRAVTATHVHGIRPEDVRGAPRFGQLVPTLVQLLAGRVVVAHNARFDIEMLAYEFGRARWAWPDVPALCTQDRSHYHLPHLSSRRLADCCSAVGVPHHNAHSALGDALATAGLLGRYLDPRVGYPFPPQDFALLHRAAGVQWPHGPEVLTPHAQVIYVPDPARSTPARFSRSAGKATALIDQLDLTQALPDIGPGPRAYLERVVRAVAGGQTVTDETGGLGLDPQGPPRELRIELHTRLAQALCAMACLDSRVTPTERKEVVAIGSRLGFDEQTMKKWLKDALDAHTAALAAALAPLPAGWAHGEPLRLGDKVAFTGYCDHRREELEDQARRAGLKVTNTVNGKAALLVTAGEAPSTKTRDAFLHGVRVVDVPTFDILLAHRQPAVGTATPAAPQSPQAPAPAPAAAEPVPASAVSPALVRAWAQENGWNLGARGRLARDVIDAYNAAHPGP